VAFESPASNLVSGDTNGDHDIFVHDRQTGMTTRVSVASDGTQANSYSYASSLSADGRYVAFSSDASNLVSGDTNGEFDIFVHDRRTGGTARVSLASDGSQGNGLSYAPSISADGRFVVFGSSASNLVSGDTNGVMDVFLHETDVVVPTPTLAPTPTPAALPDSGFAPRHGTVLLAQPAEKAYSDLGDLWLEIPRLGVQMPIVGVPQTDGEWDVSWLGDQAGWLNGTAFPTWAGNSVLTGHVYDAYGKPGPFVHLNGLWWGDKVVVHAWGAQYVYEVRQVMQVAPGATSSVIKHEELPWVTLITCRGYDEASNSYKYRVVVRAVLVEVK
jgi:LPXTG-site transpeptidase (sortase) family protein